MMATAWRWWTAAAAVVIAVAVTAAEVTASSGGRRDDIYFAAFFPMKATTGAPEGSSIGKGVMPAVNLAIKHINQSPHVLPGYKLHMYWNDTEVKYTMWGPTSIE